MEDKNDEEQEDSSDAAVQEVAEGVSDSLEESGIDASGAEDQIADLIEDTISNGDE